MISVLVCTRNRAARLALLLESLRQADAAYAAPWELIVVDNGSTDSTPEVARSFLDPALLPGRLVTETTPGTGAARNRGLRESHGNVLAFTDDDCLVAPDWLVTVERELGANAGPTLIGGRVELHDPHDRPVTIRTRAEREALTAPDGIFAFIAGCNMACTRALADRLGGFDPQFGPGSRFRSADDVDFVYRAWCAGARVDYVPELLVYHNHGRRTDREVDTLNRAYVFARGAFYAKYILRGDRDALRLALWEVRGTLSALAHRRPGTRSRRVMVGHLGALAAGAGARLLAGGRAG